MAMKHTEKVSVEMLNAANAEVERQQDKVAAAHLQRNLAQRERDELLAALRIARPYIEFAITRVHPSVHNEAVHVAIMVNEICARVEKGGAK